MGGKERKEEGKVGEGGGGGEDEAQHLRAVWIDPKSIVIIQKENHRCLQPE